MTGFLDLPSELRNLVYELCLLHQGPIKHLFDGYYSIRGLTPGLLRVNKTVHHEASSFLYGQNCFDLSETSHADVTLFLGIIGCLNARYIQHIIIDFPDFHNLEPGNVVLEQDSTDTISIFQSCCPNLRALTMSLDSTTTVLLKLDALDYPKIVIEALALVNTQLRANPSLQDIVVEVYENGPSGYVKREMESRGWTIKEIEDFEEEWGSERSYGYDDRDRYHDDLDYGYDYGDYDDDDYDIGNDSDFWRRAGD
ncbi:hypothetical protein BKA64DRAFT_654451 [Cadophora sp. MPI-SDFR-AT-0126]|nr:hypothetical protein BKA64DRAFT_654451 [Leotiomycetes sp. MPI-SDFR-AT-0126]